ncbi:MAG: IreB family regulatory phosphoprotein [Peptoniphilaceae bacterium]|nr:IreB family regulatory phosphoprotein [Peptoniphilaceae bacterium]MCI6659680.1 IreB family regulatory phosphoprotein [Peptoniphilaceae bacterium]MDD7433615.1 IreB family regulatory phosphoprotein [Peptoniphilaceae bacterium]MDY3076080.1 IreB family regulatory phosphoprotein [Peptoniphilaceae bacterium]MDY3986409.1 IreB family regulatory phosphoprotein [Peptoniphilaceae bacterium]
MSKDFNETMLFTPIDDENREMIDILTSVYESLKAKGYSPENQIIGYILSGDPTYITSYNGARKLIRQIERDDLLEELLTYYLEGNGIGKDK